jgi:bromodomain and WD repeat domain-containing protein 1/3
MYFRKGHERYIDKVKERNVYKINPREVQWLKKKNVSESYMVKVTGVRFEIRPPRLVVLKLAILDQSTGNLVGDSFTIKYHDMNDVIDFLVLHQQYNSYRGKHWKKGNN